MHSVEQMIALGYRIGAPTPAAEEIDSEIARGMKCPKCGRNMHYEGFYCRSNGDFSYIALAVCNKCGYELEF